MIPSTAEKWNFGHLQCNLGINLIFKIHENVFFVADTFNVQK
jgi:hypothetical protein